jgi:hypothetical protein
MSDVIEATEVSNLVWGARDIARVLGRSERSTFHLLESGHLPARRVGGRWVVSRKKLLTAINGDVCVDTLGATQS